MSSQQMKGMPWDAHAQLDAPAPLCATSATPATRPGAPAVHGGIGRKTWDDFKRAQPPSIHVTTKR